VTRRYRVLLVSDAYAPMIGGAERATASVAANLQAREHAVAVATAWQPGLPEREVVDGVDVHRIRDLTARMQWISEDPRKHVPPPFPDVEATLRFRRLVKEFRPDVIHSYGWLTYSCATSIARGRVPLVLSIQDYGNFCAVRTMLHMDREPCSGPAARKCLACAARHYGAVKGTVAVAGVLGSRRMLTRAAGALLSNSEYTHSAAWNHLLGRGARIAHGSAADLVMPPLGDGALDAPPDHELLARLPDRYILFVGALRRMKGLPELLEAYGRLTSPPALVLVGTPEIDTPGRFPPGVVALGPVGHATVMGAWDRAVFGVFPSASPEPFGLVVHEAMSRGRAAIGTTPGGHAEMIVDGETGLLVPHGDVDALTRAMRRLLDDPALCERLGEAGRRRAERLAGEHAIDRLEELYEAAVAA